MKIITRLVTAGRAALASLLALALTVSAPVEAFAQRRRGEPEANPQFSREGGPVGESEPRGASAPDDEPLPTPRQVQGVQIGAGAPVRAAGAASLAPLDTRVTVRVKGAPLATFLDTISAQAKVNFIITEGLESKRVTAFLQNVTVREALQVLLEIKGLSYQQIGKSNTYVVTPRSREVKNLITRIYTLNYVPLIALQDEGGSSDDQSATQTMSNAGAAVANGGQGQGGGGSGNSPSGSSEGVSPEGKPQASASATAGKVGIITVVKSVLSSLGKVVIEPRTNSLIVTDIPEIFPQVEQIIAELDKKAPQVMIEAQIVEIDSRRDRELGFDWGSQTGELATFTGGARDTSFPLNLPKDLSRARFFDPLTGYQGVIGGGATANIGTSIPQQTGGFLRNSVLDLTSLKITLRALISRQEGRFLGKPKVLTLNNKTATIAITRNEAVALQPTQTSAGVGGAISSVTPQRYDTGLVLKVTPQVNKEGYITMLVEPAFTDTQEAVISSDANRIFNPVTRSAKTLVRVKNGQTLVLGGLLQSKETKLVRKVPLLGYIPIVGWLFSSTSYVRENIDLVVFITPTIVSD